MTYRSRQHSAPGVITALFMTILLAGCGSDPGFDERVDFARKNGTAQFINMMPDSPELNVLFGFQQSTVGFPFTSGLENYVEDQYNWEIRYLDSDANEVEIATGEDLQITENVITTFLMFGSTRQADIQIIEHTQLPAEDRPENQTEMWFASNLSAFSSVDVYLTDFDAVPGAPLATVTSGTHTQVFTVTPGQSRQLRVMEAGTQNLLFDSGEIVIVDQVLELFAIVDDYGPGGSGHVDVIRSLAASETTIADVSQAPVARVVNLSSTASINVDMGSSSFTGISQGATTTFQTVPSGEQTLAVNDGSNELLSRDATTLPGTFHSTVVFDDDAAETQPAARALVTINIRRQLVERALIQVVNGTNDVLDVYALRDSDELGSAVPAFNDIGFGATVATEFRPGATTIVFTNGDRSQTYTEFPLTLNENDNFIFAIDADNNFHDLTITD